jgi:hypothetical protein
MQQTIEGLPIVLEALGSISCISKNKTKQKSLYISTLKFAILPSFPDEITVAHLP